MLEKLNSLIQVGVNNGILQNFTNDELINSSQITVNESLFINFGSCSYLGLEFHETLKSGVHEALSKFGTQFSTSRTYLSIGLYETLEKALVKIYNKPLIISASTTLGHLSALPVVVGKKDAVVIDLQVHSSVQMSVQLLKANNIDTFVIPHNCLESLEKKIKTLSQQYDRVWYLADGVYSMYGDYAPLKELEVLLNKYKKFHLYIDDAHGTGWTGTHGCGYVRSQIEHHDKMVLAISLNKSFASAGGAIIFPNKEWQTKVKNCGSTMIFSGPIQPPMLGAAIASANLHLSQDIEALQSELKEKIAYTNHKLETLGLPQYQKTDSPLFFIPAGLPKITLNIIKRMRNKGFHMNAAGFPAVPMKKGGIRFMITNNLTFDQIEAMLLALQQEYVNGIYEESSSLEEVSKVFKLPPLKIDCPIAINEQLNLNQHTYNTIGEIDANHWNNYFSQEGSLTYKNLKQLERLFSNNELLENNWDIKYHSITDDKGEVLLMGVYSICLMMDDLLADSIISKTIKEHRIDDPYFLTSSTLITGTPFTKGTSVYINYNHPNWKQGVSTFIKHLQEEAEKEQASKIIIQDFNSTEVQSLKKVMEDNGLIDHQLPNNCVIPQLNWNNHDEYLARFDHKYRYSLKKEILRHENNFEVRFDAPKTLEEQQYCYDLYLQVQQKALDISVFELPFSLFQHMCNDDEYDIIRLYLKNHLEKPVAVMFSHINNKLYNAMLVGLDYNFVKSNNTYKQILYQTVVRAKSLNCDTLDLAYTAEMEKKKVGAIPQPTFAFIMALEHFSHAQMESLR